MHLKFAEKLLCLFLVSMALPTNTFAQSFEEAYAQIVQEARLQNYQNAITLSERILPQAKQSLGENSLNLSNFLNSLAGFYEQTQQPMLARPLYEQVLAIRANQLPAQHPEYLKSIHKLANIHFVLGDYAAAKQTYKLIFQANSVENPLPLQVLFNAYSNLGTLHYHQKNFVVADSLFEISHHYLSQINPADTALQIVYLEKKIQLSNSLGRYNKVLGYYGEILPLLHQWYGQTHPYYLQTLHQKLLLYNQLKMYQQTITTFEAISEVLWQKAPDWYALLLEGSYAYLAQENLQRVSYLLKFVEKNYTSLPLALLGRYWHLQALYAQKETKNTLVSQAFQQSIQAYQTANLKDTSRLVNVYYEWAIWEDTQKNYFQSEKIWKELTTNHATTENTAWLKYNLATTYYKNEQFEEARITYETIYMQPLASPMLKTAVCLQLGRLARATQRTEEACSFYQEARSTWQRNANDLPKEYYEAVQEEAQIYQQFNQYAKAISLLEKVLENDVADAEVNLRSQLAILYYLNGQHTAAQVEYTQITKLLDPSQPAALAQLITTFNNLSNLYKNQGFYEEASQLLEKAMQLCTTQTATTAYLKMLTLYNVANLQRSLGKLEEAEASLKEAAGYAENQHTQSRDLLLEIELSQANLTRQKGQFAQAELQYIKLLDALATQRKNTPLYQEAQRQVALLYLQTGRYPSAIQQLETLANQNEEILLNDLSNELASAYQKVGRSTEAEALLISMIEMRKQRLGSQHPDIAAAQDQLGHLYRQKGNFEEAKRLFELAYQNRLSTLGTTHPSIAISKNHLALVAEQQQDFAQAETLYQQSLELIQEKLGKDHLFYIQALNNLATLYEKNNMPQLAFDYYQIALAQLRTYINQNIGVLSEQEKKQFWEANQTLIKNFLSFTVSVIAQPQNFKSIALHLLLKELLNLRLHTKGLLLNHTRKTQSDLVRQAPPATQTLYAQWQANREWLAHHFQKKPTSALQRKIDSLQKATKNLEKELVIQAQDFAPLFIPTTSEWKNIQKKLKTDEAALEMIRLPQQDQTLGYLAIIILPQNDAPIPVLFTEGEALETNYWAAYKNSIRFQEKDMHSYERYWHKIQTILDQAQVKKLYFSADGIYHLINVATLYDPQEGLYLDEKMTFVQFTNLQDLIDQRPLKFKKAHVSLWGRPSYSLDASSPSYYFKDLPFTELEVTQIAALLKEKKWKVDLFLGKEAREQTLKESPAPAILHLATHGYFEEQAYTPVNTHNSTETWLDPLLQSGLVWAGINTPSVLAAQEDGKLTALEVSQLTLYETALVVLSACQTGLGKVEGGEGVYGLQRAFQVAGARQLLMSLWEVDDRATQQFMTFFYENLLKTQNSTEALRAARTQTRLLYPNPYYWGAFILLGQ